MLELECLEGVTRPQILVLGFSHRCNQVALVGIVPPAVPINLMEV